MHAVKGSLAEQQLATVRSEQAAARSYAQQLEQQLASERAAAAVKIRTAESNADVAKAHAAGLEAELDTQGQELAEMQVNYSARVMLLRPPPDNLLQWHFCSSEPQALQVPSWLLAWRLSWTHRGRQTPLCAASAKLAWFT